jgi:hypothetical protein
MEKRKKMREQLDKVENPPIIRGDVETTYIERLIVRLRQLEAFVYGMVSAEKEFARVEDVNDKPENRNRTISERESYEFFFGTEDEVNETLEDMRNTLIEHHRAIAAKARTDAENRKKEAARVARLRAEQVEIDKKAAAMKVEAEKRSRKMNEMRKKDEERIRKIEEEK